MLPTQATLAACYAEEEKRTPYLKITNRSRFPFHDSHAFLCPSNLLCSVHRRKRSCRGSPRLVGMSTSSVELMGTLTYPG